MFTIQAKDFQLYADCLRSGQLACEDVVFLFDRNPLFKIWYKHRYLLNKEHRCNAEKWIWKYEK